MNPVLTRAVSIAVLGVALGCGGDGGEARISAQVSEGLVKVGESVTIAGRVSDPPESDAEVLVREDPYPFDGFRDDPFRRARIGDDGRFTLRAEPQRNTRYEVALADSPTIRSNRMDVFVDLDIRLAVRGSRARLVVTSGPGVTLPASRVHVYRGREGRSRMTRIATVVPRNQGPPGVHEAAFEVTSPQTGDRYFACASRRLSPAYGRGAPPERRCGEPAVTRPPPSR